MSSYRFGRVTYQNFGPFAHAEVDFSAPGLTVIEGDVAGLRGCDSNGAGKSFLLDGIAWATFGRCIRAKYAGDEVMRRVYAPDESGTLQVVLDKKGKPEYDPLGTAVSVELVGGPQEIRYTRYRKHPTYKDTLRLWVGGKEVTQGRNSMTEGSLETILGMDFTTFSNSVAFGARDDIKSFFTAPDTEKKAILDRILGLEVYAEAHQIARNRLREVEAALEGPTKWVTTLEAQIEAYTAVLDSNPEQSEEDCEQQIEEQKQRCDELAESVRCLSESRKVLEAQLSEMDAARKESLAQFKADRCELQDELGRVTDRLGDLRSSCSRVMRDLDSYSAERVKLKDSVRDKTCPTCHQPMALEGIETMLSELEAKTKAAQARSSELERQREQLQAQQQKLKQDLQFFDATEPVFPLYDETRSEFESVRGDLRVTQRSLEHAEERLTDLTNRLVERRRRQQEIEDKCSQAKRDLKKASREISEIESDRARLELCVELFGPTGLRSFLVESAIPQINQTATSYARRLCGDGAVVRLKATTKLKSKKGIEREKLSIIGSIPGCADTYDGASKGQKKRLDLALLMAYRDIVSKRSTRGVEQLFADELFDGLDASGTAGVIDLLRELSSESPVILVTHDQRLKSVGDRAIVVQHRNGTASIEGSSAPITTTKKRVRRKV
jgi:DNA repair exonuclease SbcCD ATPase subunit